MYTLFGLIIDEHDVYAGIVILGIYQTRKVLIYKNCLNWYRCVLHLVMDQNCNESKSSYILSTDQGCYLRYNTLLYMLSTFE